MSHTIDCVCYNLVENVSRGHPPLPCRNFYPLAPPPLRNFHSPSLGGGGGYGYFLESHIKGKSSKEVTSQLSIFSCWICQEELSSQELLLEHYDNYMRSE